jgi:hypothetical protein
MGQIFQPQLISYPFALFGAKSLQTWAFGVIIHKTFLAWIFPCGLVFEPKELN